MGKWLAQFVLPIAAAMSLLLAVIALGRSARAALRDRPQYTVAFRDIACTPPPGQSRGGFLAEVHRDSPLPERLYLLDGDLPDRLARVFVSHPRVESVRRVRILPPPSAESHSRAEIVVELVYREPVLAVRSPNDTSRASCRIVDRNGILLPDSAREPHLPVLIADGANPTGPAGTHCGDRRVLAAAAIAAFLKPYLFRLRLDNCEIDLVDNRAVLRKPDLRILWGHAPGQEDPGEASAAVKRQRLLDYREVHDGLEGLEHDVRLLAYKGHFPLPSEPRPFASGHPSRDRKGANIRAATVTERLSEPRP